MPSLTGAVHNNLTKEGDLLREAVTLYGAGVEAVLAKHGKEIIRRSCSQHTL